MNPGLRKTQTNAMKKKKKSKVYITASCMHQRVFTLDRLGESTDLMNSCSGVVAYGFSLMIGTNSAGFSHCGSPLYGSVCAHVRQSVSELNINAVAKQRVLHLSISKFEPSLRLLSTQTTDCACAHRGQKRAHISSQIGGARSVSKKNEFLQTDKTIVRYRAQWEQLPSNVVEHVSIF